MLNVHVRYFQSVDFFGVNLAFKAVEPFLHEREKSFPIHLQVMRGDDGLINFLGQNFLHAWTW